jgi:hypothetical protein
VTWKWSDRESDDGRGSRSWQNGWKKRQKQMTNGREMLGAKNGREMLGGRGSRSWQNGVDG